MSQYKNQDYYSQSNTKYYGNSNTGYNGAYNNNNGPGYSPSKQYINTQQDYPSNYEQHKDPRAYEGGNGYDSQAAGGYSPSKSGYDSQAAGGYSPSKSGYDSQTTGGYPPNNGYTSSKGGYDSQVAGGYPPSNNGYPPSNNGYSPSNNGYPSSKSGYDSQVAGGYPPSDVYNGNTNQNYSNNGYYARDNNSNVYPSSQQKDPYITPFDDPPRSPYYNRNVAPYAGQSPSHPQVPPYPQKSNSPSPRPGYPLSPTTTFNDAATIKGSSKPLYDEKDPNAPRPPSTYGAKPEGLYDPAFKGHDDDYQKDKPKYGGFMGTFCCCFAEAGCGTTCAIICCVLVLVIVAVVIAVLLWAKPPKVEFMGVVSSPDGLAPYVKKTTGFDFNFGLNISVNNPNIVGASFKSIKATAFYPGFTTAIGGGNKTDVKIGANSNTTIIFPFSINYDASIDPGFVIVNDILSKCGLTGGQKQKLKIDYTLIISFKVIAITVSPSFNKNAEIDCPIQNGQLPNIPGLNLGGFPSSSSIPATGGKKPPT